MKQINCLVCTKAYAFWHFAQNGILEYTEKNIASYRKAVKHCPWAKGRK